MNDFQYDLQQRIDKVRNNGDQIMMTSIDIPSCYTCETSPTDNELMIKTLTTKYRILVWLHGNIYMYNVHDDYIEHALTMEKIDLDKKLFYKVTT